MSGSQGPGGSSLPQKPEAPTPPPEESRSNTSPERPLISRLGPSARPDSRDFRERDERDRDRDRDRFYDRDRDNGRGRGRGRGFGRGAPPRRDYSPRRDDRRPPLYARDRSPPRRREYSPPRRGGRPSYDDRRAGPYRPDYRDSRAFASSSRRPASPSWRQRDRSPRPRRSPPPYRPRSRSRDRRRPSSRSPPRRSLSPRKGSLSRRSRSKSPIRRKTPLSTRRSRSRSSSRSPRRSASPPKVKCRLPPIGAPTGPRSGRRVVEHPAYDPTLAAQFSPEEQPSVRPVEAEPLELGQLEPEIVVKDEPMDVEPAKPEEVVVSLPLASTSESTVVHHSSSPVRPSHKHRTPSPPSAMAIDEQIPDIRPPSPTKEEPVHQPVKIEVKAEPSIPTRPRRFFEDHPPVRVERSSPGPKSEGRQYGRDDRHSPAPSHLHIKDSPNSPRSPRLKTEDRFNEHSRRSSAMHTPSIPSQELTGSAAHSPRLPFDAPPLERASSEHKPSFMRMGPRTEHEHGRHPHPQRESTLRDKEKQAETLYSTTDVNDYKLKHQKRMQLERESQAMACQLYTDMQELSSALLDLQSAQARTKLAAAMSDLARAGKLGIDYPPNQVNMWDRADNAI